MRINRIIECGAAVIVTVLLSCELGCAGAQPTPVAPTPVATKPKAESSPDNETLEVIKVYFDRGRAYVKDTAGKSWPEIKAQIKSEVCQP